MYGVETYIERCLSSIFANPEARERAEILLIDDGSPDKSAEVAQQWLNSNKITNAKIISQENRGLGGARNTGLRNASAPWIWFVDSDDEIMPDALANILSRLDLSLDFLIFNYVYLPQNRLGYKYQQTLENIDIEVIASMFPVNSPCFNIFRTEFMINNELFFREKFLHEDNELAVRIIYAADKVAYYPIVIYKYYLANTGSITNTSVSSKKIDNLLQHFETYNLLCAKKPISQKLKAIQQINSVPIYWLLTYLYIGSISDIARTARLINVNRRIILKSINRLSIIYRFKVWIKTNPYYIKYKLSRKIFSAL